MLNHDKIIHRICMSVIHSMVIRKNLLLKDLTYRVEEASDKVRDLALWMAVHAYLKEP